MDGSCENKASCSYSNTSKIIIFVKNIIESCIYKYMNFEETANYLLHKHNISRDITKTIWEQLQKENPEFFSNYNLRCKTVVQAKMLKDLVEKHEALVFEHTRASVNAEPSPPNLAWYNANGPSVLPQIPNDQQNQFQPFSESFVVPVVRGSSVTQNDQQGQLHQYQWPTSNHLASTSLGAPTPAPVATDQWWPLIDPACDYPGAPTNELPATDQWCSYDDDLFSLASTMLENPSTFGFGSDIGHNGPSFQDTDMELAPQLLMHSNGQIPDISRLYPPHLQLQQNFSVEAPQTPQCGGGSNGLQNGGVSSGLQNEGGFNELQNGRGSSGMHCEGGSNGIQNGGVSNGMHSGGVSNRFHSGGGSNGLENGGVSNRFHSGGGSNMFHCEGGSNGLENGGVNNGMHSGGGSNRMHSGGGSNRMHSGGGSNGLQNGETTHQQLWPNFDTNQSWRLHTSVDEQQAGGVKRHHPESEALNNPDIGDGTLKRLRKSNDGP